MMPVCDFSMAGAELRAEDLLGAQAALYLDFSDGRIDAQGGSAYPADWRGDRWRLDQARARLRRECELGRQVSAEVRASDGRLG